MKILLCWSGDQSHELAKALSWWLPLVHVAFETRLAPAITPGVQWVEAWQSATNESQFGVVCVTPDNLRSPWLMFEAGASINAWQTQRVVAYLHCTLANDVTDTPMGVLRCKTATYEGTLQLVLLLNAALPVEQRLTEAGLHVLVKPLWVRLEKALTQFGVVAMDAPTRMPSTASLQLATRTHAAPSDNPKSSAGRPVSDAPAQAPSPASLQLATRTHAAPSDNPKSSAGRPVSEPSRRSERAAPLSEPPEWSAVLDDGCIDHVTLDDLTILIERGQIGPDTPVRKEGMSDFCAAHRFGELNALLRAPGSISLDGA